MSTEAPMPKVTDAQMNMLALIWNNLLTEVVDQTPGSEVLVVEGKDIDQAVFRSLLEQGLVALYPSQSPDQCWAELTTEGFRVLNRRYR